MEKIKSPVIFLLPENSSFGLNFQSYHFDKESVVFIPANQFIDVNSTVRSIPVNPESLERYRFLFSHVLTLGHIDADEKIKTTTTQGVLNYSIEKWKKLNPFNTTDEELNLLFDTNDWLNQNVAAAINLKNDLLSYDKILKLSKEKLQLTLFQWKNHKLINQARRTLVETRGSVKETSYALGFKDTAYFCRFFKANTSLSPGEFVGSVEEKPREMWIAESFKSMLKSHICSHHKVSFYASELNLTTKALNRILKSTTGRSAKKHIQNELISTAQIRIKEGHLIRTVAFELGFEEVSHFSNFFKHHTGQSPSDICSKSTIK